MNSFALKFAIYICIILYFTPARHYSGDLSECGMQNAIEDEVL